MFPKQHQTPSESCWVMSPCSPGLGWISMAQADPMASGRMRACRTRVGWALEVWQIGQDPSTHTSHSIPLSLAPVPTPTHAMSSLRVARLCPCAHTSLSESLHCPDPLSPALLYSLQSSDTHWDGYKSFNIIKTSDKQSNLRDVIVHCLHRLNTLRSTHREQTGPMKFFRTCVYVPLS